MTYIYKSPLQERDGNFAVTAGLITGATNTNWDDAYGKRVDTWTFPLLYSDNVASISLINSGIDHGGLAGLLDDDHAQYFADTTVGVRGKDYSTTGTVSVGELVDNGLTALTGVYTDSLKKLVSIAPSSGILGHWSRTGTVITSANIGDDLTLTGNLTIPDGGTISAGGGLGEDLVTLNGTLGEVTVDGGLEVNQSADIKETVFTKRLLAGGIA